MKISVAAAASGCHSETIRYYERIGLLPKSQRQDNGYRDYTTADVERIGFVTRGRDLGFSLEEISSLLRLAPASRLSCTEACRIAEQHLVGVRARIAELRRMARELERAVINCSTGASSDCKILNALRGVGSTTSADRRCA